MGCTRAPLCTRKIDKLYGHQVVHGSIGTVLEHEWRNKKEWRYFSARCELISLFSLFTLLSALLTDLPLSSIPLSQAFVRFSAPLLHFIGQGFLNISAKHEIYHLALIQTPTVTCGLVTWGSIRSWSVSNP